MKIGYERVSTTAQSHDSQTVNLRTAGCEKIYRDTGSGSVMERPQLAACLADLRAGDVLIVLDLSRLGRSMPHLVQVAGELNARGVELVSLREGIDSTTAQGRLVFGLFAALAEFERDLIRERIRAGLNAAAASGRRGGRPVKLTSEQVAAAVAMEEAGKSRAAIARVLGISRSTLYRALK